MITKFMVVLALGALSSPFAFASGLPFPGTYSVVNKRSYSGFKLLRFNGRGGDLVSLKYNDRFMVFDCRGSEYPGQKCFLVADTSFPDRIDDNMYLILSNSNYEIWLHQPDGTALQLRK